MVAYQGFAIRQVFDAAGRSPAWAYTVGLHAVGAANAHPEVFISGLTRELRAVWLLQLGFLVKGPPSREAQLWEARMRGVTIEDLDFPPGGVTLQPGYRYHLAQGDLPGCFGPVEQRYYEGFFGQAIAYHGTAAFPVLQYVWSDTRGKFAWEAGYDSRLRDKQELLFDSHLPLKEWNQ